MTWYACDKHYGLTCKMHGLTAAGLSAAVALPDSAQHCPSWYFGLPQAMSLMLPKNVSRRQLPDEATLDSRMDCLKITSSYSCAALNNVNLDAILDDIKGNLRKEQHTVLELNWHVLYHVLAPIQVSFS